MVDYDAALFEATAIGLCLTVPLVGIFRFPKKYPDALAGFLTLKRRRRQVQANIKKTLIGVAVVIGVAYAAQHINSGDSLLGPSAMDEAKHLITELNHNNNSGFVDLTKFTIDGASIEDGYLNVALKPKDKTTTDACLLRFKKINAGSSYYWKSDIGDALGAAGCLAANS